VIQAAIVKYGLPKVIGAGAALLVVLLVVGSLGWNKARAWYYEIKAERAIEQRDVARAETKVARKDEAQVTRAAGTTAETVAAQDTHVAAQREATGKTDEVIHDRIRQAPVAPAAAPADDPVVRGAVNAAVARAQGAEARLRGTPSR
jgi:hypothetical protein